MPELQTGSPGQIDQATPTEPQNQPPAPETPPAPPSGSEWKTALDQGIQDDLKGIDSVATLANLFKEQKTLLKHRNVPEDCSFEDKCRILRGTNHIGQREYKSEYLAGLKEKNAEKALLIKENAEKVGIADWQLDHLLKQIGDHEVEIETKSKVQSDIDDKMKDDEKEQKLRVLWGAAYTRNKEVAQKALDYLGGPNVFKKEVLQDSETWNKFLYFAKLFTESGAIQTAPQVLKAPGELREELNGVHKELAAIDKSNPRYDMLMTRAQKLTKELASVQS